jgi:hypothetical protein
MISAHAKDWFKDYMNVMGVVVFLVMGLSGQSKELILALLVFTFCGLVAKFSYLSSFVAAMLLSTFGAGLFL